MRMVTRAEGDDSGDDDADGDDVDAAVVPPQLPWLAVSLERGPSLDSLLMPTP